MTNGLPSTSFFFSSRRRHTRYIGDWSSDVCSSDLEESIAQRFERDREKLLPLPATPYEACEKRTTRASSQARVRYETNDYAVPVAYGHRQVLVKAFVWE